MSKMFKKITHTYPKTKDSDFTEAKAKFKKSTEQLDRINGHMTSFLENIQSLLLSQKKVAEDMTVGLGDGDFESPIVTEHIAIIDQAIADKAKLDDDVRKYFQDPLNKYKAQYREIDERIRERKRRCDEMDKLKDEVKRYTEKKDVRLATTEKRCNNAIRSYEDLNKELITDIPLLIKDKKSFFEPMVANLVDIEIKFFANMAAKLHGIQEKMTNVDRNGASTHPRAVRPRNESAVTKSYSTPMSQTSQPTQTTQPQNTSYTQQPPLPSKPGMAPSLPPKLPQAKALWNFTGQDSTELSFNAGDILSIHSQQGDWWQAEKSGVKGSIPANYVQIL